MRPLNGVTGYDIAEGRTHSFKNTISHGAELRKATVPLFATNTFLYAVVFLFLQVATFLFFSFALATAPQFKL